MVADPSVPSQGGYQDNPMQIGSLITSATIVAPQTTRQADRIQVSATEASEDAITAQYAQMAPELKKSLAVKLKAAGYKVPVTNKYSSIVRDQFIQASRDFNQEIRTVLRTSPQLIGQNVETVDSYLTARANELEASKAGVTSQVYKTIYTDAKAGYLVDTVFADLTGRKPSEAEKKRYIDMVQNLQSQSPVATVIQGAGGGTTTQGIGAEEVKQYLIDEIGGTDDAKRVRIQDGYQTILNALGVSL